MAKRKTKKPRRKKTKTLDTYLNSRDKFFKDHPRIRVLLALFVVSFAVYMALLISFAY